MLIPFPVQIPADKVDKELKYKLERESSGILNWIVQGAMMWQSEGLNPPQIVTNASKEYRDEMDVISFFVSECCEIGDGYQAPAGELFETYKNWAEDSSEYSMRKQKFGREMKKKFSSKRTNQGIYYQGLRLKTDPRMNFVN